MRVKSVRRRHVVGCVRAMVVAMVLVVVVCCEQIYAIVIVPRSVRAPPTVHCEKFRAFYWMRRMRRRCRRVVAIHDELSTCAVRTSGVYALKRNGAAAVYERTRKGCTSHKKS